MRYPATIQVRTPERFEWWRPLMQWLLAIPHLIIAEALEGVAGAIAIISWFVILFTGELPVSFANFQVMILRYRARALLYAGFLYEEYPPFDFEMSPAEPGGSPVDLAIQPALGDRNKLTVGLRLFCIIPAVLFMAVIGIVGIICWVLAFFAVSFTGQWPDGLRSWATKMVRVSLRLDTYALLLTDEYPPFSTD